MRSRLASCRWVGRRVPGARRPDSTSRWRASTRARYLGSAACSSSGVQVVIVTICDLARIVSTLILCHFNQLGGTVPTADIHTPRRSGLPNLSSPGAGPAIAGTIRPRRRIAPILWLALAGIWGSTWLAIKLGLRDLPPLTFAGIRFALAAMLLGGIVLIQRVRLPRSAGEWGLLAYTGCLTITLNYALVFWGEQYISSGLAALLSATVPLFGLPLAHRYLSAEPLTRRKVVGVLLGVLGVAVVFSGELSTGGPRAFAASAGIIAAALATAHASVLIKARGTHIEPAVLAGTQMLGGCLRSE